jgi:hypothetical protein
LDIKHRLIKTLFGSVDLHKAETSKTPTRTQIINFLIENIRSNSKTSVAYLEIGVRNPDDNFNKVIADDKVGVDPAVQFVGGTGFTLTSDSFFEQLGAGVISPKATTFDLVFIDGLHEANQVYSDVENALKVLRPNGYVVLHDCSPPLESFAREDYSFMYSPAAGIWLGTSWKAFVKYRMCKTLYSCCIDSDWGVGILSPDVNIGAPLDKEIMFFDYKELDSDRDNVLGMVSFDQLKTRISKWTKQ